MHKLPPIIELPELEDFSDSSDTSSDSTNSFPAGPAETPDQINATASTEISVPIETSASTDTLVNIEKQIETLTLSVKTESQDRAEKSAHDETSDSTSTDSLSDDDECLVASPASNDHSFNTNCIVMIYPPPPNYPKLPLENPILKCNFFYPDRKPVSLMSLQIERPKEVTDFMLYWYNKNAFFGCWRCMKTDHFIKNCPEPILFPICYNCGLKYYTVVNCPVCSEDYLKYGPYTRRYLSTRQKKQDLEH